MQVKDTGGKTCDQDVSRFVVGSSSQVVKDPFLVEEVSMRAEAKLLYNKNISHKC